MSDIEWAIECLECGNIGNDLARETALAALREKAEREKNRRAEPENRPLTLDEVKTLEDEPIWIQCLEYVEESCWAISGERSATGICLHDKYCDRHYEDYGAYELYGKTWLAYRRKPEGNNP